MGVAFRLTQPLTTLPIYGFSRAGMVHQHAGPCRRPSSRQLGAFVLLAGRSSAGWNKISIPASSIG